MHIAVALPPEFDDAAISARAARLGVIFPALSAYFGHPPKSPGLLLGFCGFATDEMTEPIAVLRNAIGKERRFRP